MTAAGRAMPVAAAASTSVSLAIRPESIRFNGADICDTMVSAEIGEGPFLGSVIRIKAKMLGAAVEFDMFNRPDMPQLFPGSRVVVGLNNRDLLLFDT